MAWWRRIIRSEITLRFVALALAIVLWFLAADTGMEPAGLEDQRVSAPIEVRNVPGGLVVGAAPGTAQVHLRVSRGGPAVDASAVTAFADVRGRTAGLQGVPVQVNAPTGVQVIGVQPAEVHVRLDRVIRREFPIEVAVIGLSPGAPFDVVSVTPQTVAVEGPEARVDQVARVIAWWDAARLVGVQPGGNSPEQTARLELKPVDAGGAPLFDLHVLPETVEVVGALGAGALRQPGRAEPPLASGGR